MFLSKVGNLFYLLVVEEDRKKKLVRRERIPIEVTTSNLYGTYKTEIATNENSNISTICIAVCIRSKN